MGSRRKGHLKVILQIKKSYLLIKVHFTRFRVVNLILILILILIPIWFWFSF